MPAIGLVTTLARQPFRLARFAAQAVETVARSLIERDDGDTPAPTGPQPPRSAPPPDPTPVVAPEAKVIDDEPILVRESVEPGAVDAPGPEIHVEEPFDGYDLLRATDVIDRLRAATTEEVAAIELYEGAHKDRPTVMAAAKLRLTELSPA